MGNKFMKYPKSYHLPWSEGFTSDDKRIKKIEHFIGKDIVVTEKLDGENLSMYRNHIHARSLDSSDHESRHWVKMFHSTFAYRIPKNWRFCGENVYATHSIHYQELSSYFYLFNIWNEENVCLSWDETVKWATELGIETVPVLYRGVFDEKKVKETYSKRSALGGEQEGYVVRFAESFHYDDFRFAVGKFVRKDHVQTDEHWLNQRVIPNQLKKM